VGKGCSGHSYSQAGGGYRRRGRWHCGKASASAAFRWVPIRFRRWRTGIAVSVDTGIPVLLCADPPNALGARLAWPAAARRRRDCDWPAPLGRTKKTLPPAGTTRGKKAKSGMRRFRRMSAGRGVCAGRALV